MKPFLLYEFKKSEWNSEKTTGLEQIY